MNSRCWSLKVGNTEGLLVVPPQIVDGSPPAPLPVEGAGRGGAGLFMQVGEAERLSIAPCHEPGD